MTTRTVTTQAELDKAIADRIDYIDIRSERGMWLDVRACDSSTVRACDSSTVRACDSSTVTAYGSSTVTAYDSSTVTAYGSSTVTAYGSSTVTAKSRVAVHLHSGRATIAGGVIIDHTQEPDDPAAWCAWHDIDITDGIATVYKAVNDRWTTGRGTDYSPGALPSCDDWSDDNECGGGLHFSPTPVQALAYHGEATRFVAVGVAVADLRPILGSTPKCKAPRVARACVEVDINGREVSK